MNNSKLFKTIEYAVSVVLFVILFLGFYSVSKGCILTGAQNDSVAHFYSGMELFNSIFDENAEAFWALSIQIATYPVWHATTYALFCLLTWVFGSIFTQEAIISVSIALVNSACIYITWLLIREYLKRVLNGKYNILVSLVSVLLLIVGPVDASGLLGRYYLGGYTANVWHNPGYIMVRPVAIYCFYKYIDILNSDKNKSSDYVKVSISMLVAGLIKPIFFIAFIPALFVMCVAIFCKQRNMLVFWNMCKIAFTCIPVGILSIIQIFGINMVDNIFLLYSGREDAAIKGCVASTSNNISQAIALLSERNPGIEIGGLGIKFLYVWKTYTTRWGISLLVSITFPLLIILLITIKKMWNKELILTFLLFISALLEYMVFYVSSHPFSGDFAWGFQLSIFFLFMWAAGQLLDMKMETKLDKFIKVLGLVLFAAHAFFGICYAADIVYTLDILQPLHYFNYDVVNNVFL